MTIRKLIRPNWSEIRDQTTRHEPGPPKRVPPETTSAENYYYIKQMAARTPMVVTLTTGEEIKGTIEWYDRNCIKVHRGDGPNLLIFKHVIKHIHKQDDGEGTDKRGPD